MVITLAIVILVEIAATEILIAVIPVLEIALVGIEFRTIATARKSIDVARKGPMVIFATKWNARLTRRVVALVLAVVSVLAVLAVLTLVILALAVLPVVALVVFVVALVIFVVPLVS